MTEKKSIDYSLLGQIGAATRWANEPDRTAATAPARAGMRAKLEREVDPEGRLHPAERARRADQLHKAHMLKMSLASKAARAAKKAAKERGSGNS